MGKVAFLRGVNTRNPDDFRFHVVNEYSLAIFVTEIFHLCLVRLCVCVCLTSSPAGHPECADSKRIAHQYSCEFMLSLMLQQIVSDRSNSQLVSASTLVYLTLRRKVSEK